MVSGAIVLLYGLGQLSDLAESVLFFVMVQILEFLNIAIEYKSATLSMWSSVTVALH